MVTLNTLNFTYKNTLHRFNRKKELFNSREFTANYNSIGVQKIQLSLHLVTNPKYADSIGALFLKVKRFAEAGGTVVQIRFKEEDVKENITLAKQVIKNIPGMIVIINDRPDVAWTSRAHGVHLGPTDISPDDARDLLGKDSIVGYTANSLEDVMFANECKSVDYIGLQWNPSKTSRVHSPKVWGVEIRDAISIAQKPVVVIGGITEDNLQEILGYLRPGDTVAVGGEILKVDDPFKPTQKMYEIIKSHFDRNRE